MNKSEFLAKLRAELRGLPPQDADKTIAYYDEAISDRIEDGASEEAAVASLGTPEKIARDLLAHQPFSKIIKLLVEDVKKATASTNSVAKIIILVLLFPVWFPLGIAAISILTSVFITIASLVFTLWAMATGIALGGGLLLVSSIWSFSSSLIPTGFFAIGGGLALLGLAVLAFIGAYYGTIYIIKLLRLLTLTIKRLFVRRTNA